MPRQRITERSLSRKPPASGNVELWDAVLPGFGFRINAGGRRSFMVMTRCNGRQVRATVGTYPALTLAEARDAARKILSDAEKGIPPRARKQEQKREAERAERNSFRAVAEEFMLDHAKGLRTRDEYQRKLNVDIFPEWGNRPITDITRADVKALLRAKARKSPVSANRLLALIRAIFNWALDEEIIDYSPANRIKPEPETERERVLTDSEIRALWSAFDDTGYPFGSLFKLLLLTGQRRGEVAGMKWSEIADSVWRIPGERAKRGKGHAVPLSPLALKIIESVPKVSEEYLFTTTGDRPVSGWSRVKSRCDKLAGFSDWRLHDLRRTLGTGLRSLGIDRLTVSKILNHAESGITQIYDRYAADAEKRRALNTWAGHIESVVSGKRASSNVVSMQDAR